MKLWRWLKHWLADRVYAWLSDYDLSDPDIQRALATARAELGKEDSDARS